MDAPLGAGACVSGALALRHLRAHRNRAATRARYDRCVTGASTSTEAGTGAPVGERLPGTAIWSAARHNRCGIATVLRPSLIGFKLMRQSGPDRRLPGRLRCYGFPRANLVRNEGRSTLPPERRAWSISSSLEIIASASADWETYAAVAHQGEHAVAGADSQIGGGLQCVCENPSRRR